MPRLRADKIDANQKEIVDALRKLEGISVQPGMNDICVGYNGQTYWYEIKTGPKAYITPAQHKLLKSWTGHYKIVWTLQMILADIGYAKA